jgi:predicted protein tyrosine phosphatase
MTVVVCPLASLSGQVARWRPARLVSLLAPDQTPPVLNSDIPHLALQFHDIDAPRRGLVPPDTSMVQRLVDFAAAWREPAPLLLHCWMGVSRSTAAALILACALDPARDEHAAARALRAASPTATPNPLMLALADALLGRNGRLTAAGAAIGRGAEVVVAAAPFSLTVRPGRAA